ncbi:MAG: M15 family metallopeptidase [Myxococcaceae bacterium]|nr:M15 family metallopeptidase [Myxococcaceae bacterium]
MLPAVLALLAAAPTRDAGPPPGLSCLTTFYAGEVHHRPDAGWGFVIDGGTFIPWRAQARPVRDIGVSPGDGGEEDEEESKEVIDLESIYAVPYVAGPIVRLDASDAGAIDDPGRVRIEQLFLTTYGQSRGEVFDRLAKVRFFGLRYPFHELAAEPLRRVVARLEPQVQENPKLKPFLTEIGGTFIWRKIARSKNLSTHAFGIAIDLNVDRAHYWRWQRRGEPLKWNNKVPQAIVDAFEAEGFIWGGRWLHYDTMHFEYRPELLSPLCRGGAGMVLDAGVDGGR